MLRSVLQLLLVASPLLFAACTFDGGGVAFAPPGANDGSLSFTDSTTDDSRTAGDAPNTAGDAIASSDSDASASAADGNGGASGDGSAKSDAEPASQVTLCHFPDGDPSKAHTITVEPGAVASHLAHGDHLGPCT